MSLFKIKINIILLFSGLVFLNSCVSPRETNLLQEREPIYPTKELEEYKLRTNDEIFCTILTSDTEFARIFNGILTSVETSSFGSSSNVSYVVYENGCISIPFFGEIYIVGLTLKEAEQKIENKMKESFPDAQVRVRLRNNVFYVVSSGRNGVYSVYKDNMTIYQAIALSGNISSNIDISRIKIVRAGADGKDIIKTFNLRTESVIESEFYYIKPNDVIYYTTSNSSFFRVGSFTSLVSTIILPITFVLGMAAWKFW